MGFFALVTALLIERLRPLRSGNPIHATIAGFAQTVRDNLDAGERRHGTIGWLVVMIASLVAVITLEWIAASLHPVFVFALHVFVLYCTIGFQQFSEAFTEIRVAVAADDDGGARRLLKVWLHDCGVDDSIALTGEAGMTQTCRLSIAHALMVAHRHVLAPLFCYVVIPGAAGPLLYRVAEMLMRRWRRSEAVPATWNASSAVPAAAGSYAAPGGGSPPAGVASQTAAGARADADADAYAGADAYVDADAYSVAAEAAAAEAAAADVAATAAEAAAAEAIAAEAAAAEAAAAEAAATEAAAAEAAAAAASPRPSPWSGFATSAFEAIDWLPVRLTAAGFAVAGNFEDVIYCWRAAIAAGVRDSRSLLLAAGGGALGLSLGGPEVDRGYDAPGAEAQPASLQAAAGLVWRSLLMWLGLYALITVSAWMGS